MPPRDPTPGVWPVQVGRPSAWSWGPLGLIPGSDNWPRTLWYAVRTVRGLRTLGSSLKSAEKSRASQEDRHQGRAEPGIPAGSRGRSIPAPPPPPARAKEEPSEHSYTEGEESEEEDRAYEEKCETRPKSDPARKPPEPKYPPREHQPHPRPEERDWEERSEIPRRKDQGVKKKSKRAGRKRQRLYRAVENPDIRLHRKTPGTFWDQKPSLDGRSALERRI